MAENDVLKATTEIKIHELRRHDDELSRRYDVLDKELEDARDVPGKILRVLLEGVQDLQVVQERIHKDLDDLPEILSFAEVDADNVNGVLGHRADTIKHEIKCRRSLWHHNKLFGALLMDTLNDENHTTTDAVASVDVDHHQKEDVASHALEAQREDAQKRIEDYFFVPCGLDRHRIREFLEDQVFQRRDHDSDAEWERISEALRDVRASVDHFCKTFVTRRIEPADVATLATTLMADKNEFSPEVVQLLQNATQNAIVQEELAHVLTIKLSNLSEFQWPTSGVPVVMKRAINGRYRSLIQEGAIPFLLFQYIGLSWSVFMKPLMARLLKCIDTSRVGFRERDSIAERRTEVRDRFLLTALPSNMDGSDDYDDESYGSQQKGCKLDILRLVCAEAHLANTLSDDDERRSLLAVVTDLEFFGPSVSHEVVLGILSFLGVSDMWIAIFETHMKMPLRFPNATTPRVLAKGVPTSRRSSRFYSELLLFTMDYAVMATSGVFLYRTHDDILFFDEDEASVLTAWTTMNTVVDSFGLRLNKEKSGSIRLCCAEPQQTISPAFGPEPLPQKPIRWGLIELERNASIRIVEDQVDWFAQELAAKLTKTKSVLRWITVYNKYMRFFLRNFGTVSPVFGLEHADSMIEYVKHIHGIVFSATSGDVRAALRQKIEVSHPELVAGTSLELPTAWVYWPLDLGGLGLFNPLLELWSYKQTLRDEKGLNGKKWTRPFVGEREKIKQYYDKFATHASRDGLPAVIRRTFRTPTAMFTIVQSSSYSATNWPSSARRSSSDWPIDESFTMLSFGSFLRQLDKFDHTVRHEFDLLLRPTVASEHAAFKDAKVVANQAFGSLELPNENYWVWVAYFYRRELEHVFGTTSFVSGKLLPAQLINEIKKAGIYWS